MHYNIPSLRMNDTHEKLFMLFSNLFFLIFPTAYICYRMYTVRPFQPFLCIHLVLCLGVTWISLLYHLCDLPFNSSPEDTGIYRCVIPFQSLYSLDFQFSSLMAINLLSYGLVGCDTILREVCIVILFVANTVLYGMFGSYNHPSYYILTILASFTLVGVRGYRRYQRGVRLLPTEGNSKLGILCGLSFIVAFQFYILGNNAESYMLFHGYWHLFSSLGLFMGFAWIDTLSSASSQLITANEDSKGEEQANCESPGLISYLPLQLDYSDVIGVTNQPYPANITGLDPSCTPTFQPVVLWNGDLSQAYYNPCNTLGQGIVMQGVYLNNSYSQCVWVKTTSSFANTGGDIFGSLGQLNNGFSMFQIFGLGSICSPGSFQIVIYQSRQIYYNTTCLAITMSNWHYYCMTFAMENYMVHVYIDGKEITPSTGVNTGVQPIAWDVIPHFTPIVGGFYAIINIIYLILSLPILTYMIILH